MIPAPPMLTGLLSTMFSDRPAVDDVFGEGCRRLLQLMLLSQQHQVQMNVLFHPMIAVSKAGRSNRAAAAGLQDCSAAVTVQGDKTAVPQEDCPATTVQQPLHVLQCCSGSMAVLHWRISCGIAVAGAGQEQRSRSSNTPPTVLCACKLLTAPWPELLRLAP